MVRVEPVDAALGARVEGLNLTKGLSGGDFEKVHQAFLDYGVIVIPGQQLRPADQVDFSRKFGDLLVHPLYEYNHPEAEEIFVLSNVIDENGKKKGLDDGGSYWHSDFSYKKKPAMATILYGVEIPATGGDTLFIDMYKAYEALDDATKQQIEGMKAIHYHQPGGADTAREFLPPGVVPARNEGGAKISEQWKRENPPVEHPVVRIHPETGRRSLYVHPPSTHGIVGMSPEDGKNFLRKLFAHITRPEFQMRHKWNTGDVVMWDNRCTMHAATTSGMPATNRRTVYRTTVDAPTF